MKAKLFSIYSLLAIVMMLAGTTVSQAETITWNSSNVFNQEHGAQQLYSGSDPITFEGVSMSLTGSGSSFFIPYTMANEGGFGLLMLFEDEGDSFTFTAPTGKKFTKIEITNNDNILDLGDANWSAQDNQVVWSGTPSNTVTLAGNDLTAIQRITSIVFTLEEPASTTGYKVALAEDTEDAANWTIAPAAATTTGVAAGTTVSVKYSGTKKVKSIEAVKKAAEPVTLSTPLTVEALTAGTITVSNPMTGMQYSLNGAAKTAVTTTGIDVTEGDKVAFYGNGTSITSYNRTTIGGSGDGFQCKVYGNIMSLVDEENFATATELTDVFVFAYLFNGNTTLTDASDLLLPATTLTHSCYEGMFIGCTSLTAVPNLPATTLAESCYYSMFSGCTGLTTLPDKFLPATTLTDYCYCSMFDHCEGLTVAPLLPAWELADNCYARMFLDCYNLASVTCLAITNVTSENSDDWLMNAGTEATDPMLYVEPSMTGKDWSNGVFIVTLIP